MTYEILTDYTVSKGTEQEICEFFSRKYTSPTLERLKSEKTQKTFSLTEQENEEEDGFGLDDMHVGEITDDDYRTLSDERLDEELEELDDEDYEDFAGILIAGVDWGFEKIINNFANRKQGKETNAQKQKLNRLKILAKKVMIKHGVKFKIEVLFGIMLIGYFADRYKNAEIIDPNKVKNKKNNSSAVVNTVKKVENPKVKEEELEEVKETEEEMTDEEFLDFSINGGFISEEEEEEEEDEDEEEEISAENLLD